MAKRFIINGKSGKISDTNWRDSLAAPPKIIKKDSFLDECAGYTDDEYWRNIIQKMSIGKFPEGVSYSNGTLFYDDVRSALDIDPEVACYEIINFCYNTLQLRSPNEEDEEDEEVKDKSGDQWSTMLKKHKEQAIIRFMLNEQRLHDLTTIECEHLHCVLNIGFTLNYFHKDNVNVTNYSIISIDALQFDPSTHTYSIDRSQRKKESRSTSRSTAKPKKNYNDTWAVIRNRIVPADEEDENDENSCSH